MQAKQGIKVMIQAISQVKYAPPFIFFDKKNRSGKGSLPFLELKRNFLSSFNVFIIILEFMGSGVKNGERMFVKQEDTKIFYLQNLVHKSSYVTFYLFKSDFV